MVFKKAGCWARLATLRSCPALCWLTEPSGQAYYGPQPDPRPRSRVHVYGSLDNLFLKSLALNHRLSVFYPWSLLEEIIHLGLDHKPCVMELSRMLIAYVDEIPLEMKFAFKSFPPFPTQILVILQYVQKLSNVLLFETP